MHRAVTSTLAVGGSQEFQAGRLRESTADRTAELADEAGLSGQESAKRAIASLGLRVEYDQATF